MKLQMEAMTDELRMTNDEYPNCCFRSLFVICGPGWASVSFCIGDTESIAMPNNEEGERDETSDGSND
jgi:hypothetical protein